MGINVHVKDERGAILASALDSNMLLSRFALRAAARESRILRYLDPAGDLILNRAQATALLEDLPQLLAEQQGLLRALLENVRELAEQVERGTHLYLWFEGD